MANVSAEQIYQANAAAHDACAGTHDAAVPYLYRRATRDFYWRLLIDALGAAEPWRGRAVIELGCGTGTYTDRILTGGAAKSTGLDLSPVMIAKARAKYPDPRCCWEVASLEAFAEAHPAAFDVAYSFSFLHHLPEIGAGLASIERLLRPGGVYVALHELILPRERTAIEKLDDKLESVFGSAANDRRSFGRRLYDALPGRLTGRRGPDQPASAEPDCVDYQLNAAFDLQQYARPGVEVRGYSYLQFPALLRLDAPINHRLLILRKPA